MVEKIRKKLNEVLKSKECQAIGKAVRIALSKYFIQKRQRFLVLPSAMDEKRFKSMRVVSINKNDFNDFKMENSSSGSSEKSKGSGDDSYNDDFNNDGEKDNSDYSDNISEEKGLASVEREPVI